MRKYINTYLEFNSALYEDDTSKKKTISANVSKNIAKKLFKQGEKDLDNDKNTTTKSDGKTVTIPKDIQLKKLAKELYKTQYEVATFKYILADKIQSMKDDGADEDTIEQAEEMADDQMTNTQMRADAISQEMISVAGQNTNMSLKADELAQGAISAALKAAQEFYNKRSEKWLKDSKKNKKEQSDSDKDEKSDK